MTELDPVPSGELHPSVSTALDSRLEPFWGIGVEHEVTVLHDTARMAASEINKIRSGKNRRASKHVMGPAASNAKYPVLQTFDIMTATRELNSYPSLKPMLDANPSIQQTVRELSSIWYPGDKNIRLANVLHEFVKLNTVIEPNYSGDSIELVTKKFRNATIPGILAELKVLHKLLLQVLSITKVGKRDIAKYGPLKYAEVGAHSFVRIDNLDGEPGKTWIGPDMLGSYHLNITLPTEQSTREEVENLEQMVKKRMEATWTPTVDKIVDTIQSFENLDFEFIHLSEMWDNLEKEIITIIPKNSTLLGTDWHKFMSESRYKMMPALEHDWDEEEEETDDEDEDEDDEDEDEDEENEDECECCDECDFECEECEDCEDLASDALMTELPDIVQTLKKLYILKLGEETFELLRTVDDNNKDMISWADLVNDLAKGGYNRTELYRLHRKEYEHYPNDEFGKMLQDFQSLYKKTLGKIRGELMRKHYERVVHLNKLHQLWAVALQSISPLIMAVYGSPDMLAIADEGKYSEGSYRLINSEYAYVVSTNLYRDGISDERRVEPSLPLYEPIYDTLQYRIPWLAEKQDWTDGTEDLKGFYGADIRKDPQKGELFGLEYRILDNLAPEHLREVMWLVIMLGQLIQKKMNLKRGRLTLERMQNPFGHSGVIDAIQGAFAEGWNARMSPIYVDHLNRNLGLNLPRRRKEKYLAWDLLQNIYYSIQVELTANKGVPSPLFGAKSFKAAPKVLTNVNRKTWESFYNVWERTFEPHVNALLHEGASMGILTPKQYSQLAHKHMGCKWQEDFEDLLFYLESRNEVKLQFDDGSNIVSIAFTK